MTPAALAVIRAGAIRHNLHRVRALAPGCRVLAVVKANAYGHGLVTVARILQGADGLAVARLEEAAQLREAGVGDRIVVLGGFVGEDEVRAALGLGLDLVVHNLAQIDLLERLAGPRPVATIWLKVDTGMGRLGIEPGATAEARRRLRAWSGCGSLHLMTHFASADMEGGGATAAQLAVFRGLAEGWSGDVSLANSAAILRWPESLISAGGHNWVRPGLMLYGVSPLAGSTCISHGLMSAMNFETRLIAVRKLPKGHRVGYGGDWQAVRDSIVGVAAVGYADGYPWHISRGTPVLLNGQRVPVIGRVSMDMISIDLTDGPVAAPGDRVVLWGDALPVEEVARSAGSIPYALLAGISPRVARLTKD